MSLQMCLPITKVRFYFFFFVVALHSVLMHAKTPDGLTSNSSITKYQQLNALSRLGLHDEAVSQAQVYLKAYPKDVDVRFLLGVFYYREKNVLKARQELERVIAQTPNYSDVSLILSKMNRDEGRYQEAMQIIDRSLLFDPINPALSAEKASIERMSELSGSARLIVLRHKKNDHQTPKTIKITIKAKFQPHASDRINRFKKIHKKITEVKKYQNEIGLYQQNYYISDVKKIWDYTTLYYGRDTFIGKTYAKITYASRLSHQAVQGEVEAFPKLSKYLYLDLDYTFANEPNLFPNNSYSIEAFVTTDKALDFSVGGKYNAINRLHHFSIYTFSISKFLDKYTNIVTFRPYFFVPGKGSNSTLFTLNLRHILRDPYFYIGCVIGAGSSPDLADLTTINFIVVKNKIINPYINFPLYEDRLIVNLGFLYQNQLFPKDKTRNWSGGTMNLVWKF